MSDFLSFYAMPVALGAVALVLLLGLVNMMRRFAEHVAEADAPARAASVRRHHRGDDGHLGDGPLK